MATATTTCAYSSPVQFDGTPPASSLDYFAFASSTCITLSDDPATSTTEFSFVPDPENPLFVQDSGSVVFGLALILFVLIFATLGLVFGSRRRS